LVQTPKHFSLLLAALPPIFPTQTLICFYIRDSCKTLHKTLFFESTRSTT